MARETSAGTACCLLLFNVVIRECAAGGASVYISRAAGVRRAGASDRIPAEDRADGARTVWASGAPPGAPQGAPPGQRLGEVGCPRVSQE